jgi:hypothetical protein
MPVRDWGAALNQFAIIDGARNKGTFLSDYSICIKFIEKIMGEENI